MSQKKRRSSTSFRWHRSLAVLVPWKKGKGDVVLESEVVLTKIKIFNNFHERLSGAEDSFSTISISASEQDMSEPSRILDESTVPGSSENKPPAPKSEYLSLFPDSQITRLFEYEDSGVEMPSGADSPSTPTSSEQSFVVHSRESSHSLEDISTLVPAPDPRLLLERCPVAEETEDSLHLASEVKDHDLTTLEARVSLEMTPVQATPMMEAAKMQQSETEALRDTSKELEDAVMTEAATESPLEEGRIVRSCNSTEALSTLPDVDLQEEPLKKSLSMDSLDAYMDECCRLSEIQRAKATATGSGPSSGLRYLEHICQLIEKIGQLQEHNLRLQKQLSSLQKESRSQRNKEDHVLQQCCCGAVSLGFQENKRYSSSLTVSSGALSDLSTIPEVSRHSHREGEGGCHPVVSLRSNGFNRRSCTEGETRYFCDSNEGISVPHRRASENQHMWGRMKEIVKKTKLRNHSRLSLSSSSLKSSCPQLYRPDLGPVELPRRNRNSMIVLGNQSKLDFLWPH
ncbi:uncharacterized protein si:ch211-250c4.3 [Brienomyrus brachyistius]|uniref:uncharacterized protein si:ch211-250c4.3 n=1 Tax=Brienomyrus brachyistius TaxID=42636 RepID=UPI0020B26929|nr:uncharacterized protein si:ch211-250c4.3 [Brienomyrus brachyistius]